jgi:hypothetical protein
MIKKAAALDAVARSFTLSVSRIARRNGTNKRAERTDRAVCAISTFRYVPKEARLCSTV